MHTIDGFGRSRLIPYWSLAVIIPVVSSVLWH